MIDGKQNALDAIEMAINLLSDECDLEDPSDEVTQVIEMLGNAKEYVAGI